VRAEAKLAQAKTHVTTLNIVGTVCYMAPEYFRAGQITQKIDSYAFGVVLLELLTGCPPVDVDGSRQQKDIVTWLEDVMYDIFEANQQDTGAPLQTSVSERGAWDQLIPYLDPLAQWPLHKAVELLRISRMCLQPRRASRWSLREALPHLEDVADIVVVRRAQHGTAYDPETGELISCE
jgi:serine/threonine protein kinase